MSITNIIVNKPESTIVVTGNIGPTGPAGSQGIQGATGPQGPIGPTGPSAAISTASDVDISTLKNGSLLIYNQSTNKWTSNDTLAAQIVDSGQY